MPIIQSAKKQLRQNAKKAARNKRFKALHKEEVKKLEKMMAEWKKKEAREQLSQVYSAIDKLFKKNIIKRNNASRKKAKYARIVKDFCLAK